jgi:chromosome segregation ATPase
MRLFQVLTFLATSVLMNSASGADWVATDEVDGLLKVPACRAMTKVNKSNLPAEIVIAVPKDRNLLPVVYLSYTGLPTRPRWAQIRFGKKEFQPAYLFGDTQTTGEPEQYWYAPRDLPRFLEIIRKRATLDTVFDPKSATPIPVRFSLKGVAAALKQIAVCSDRKEILPIEFLKALSQQVTFGGGIAEISPSQVLTLTNAAYADFLGGRSIAGSLATLRKAMKPLTEREKKALKTQASKQAVVDSTALAIQKNQSETSRLEAEVTSATEALNEARVSLPEARNDLASKRIAYDSARATLSTFENDVHRRELALEKASSDVQQVNSDISRLQAKLRNLEDEASRLHNQVVGQERELSIARSEESSARAAYGMFNEQEEIESALRGNWRFTSLQRTLHDKNEQLHREAAEVHGLRRRLESAHSELNACRSRGLVNGLNVSHTKFELISASCDEAIRNLHSANLSLQQATAVLLQIDRICGGAPACIVTAQNHYNNAVTAVRNAEAEKTRVCAGEPPQPTPTPPHPTPTPRPPPDCRRQEEAVRHAQYELDQQETRLSAIRSEIESLKRQIHTIESEVRSTVAARGAELKLKYDNAVARTYELSQDLESARRRLGRITGEEMPHYESALATTRARLPALNDREAEAESRLEVSRRALEVKRQEIGWSAIESAYREASSLVHRIESRITELDKVITSAKAKIGKLVVQLPKLQQALVKQNQDLSAAAAIVVAIQSQLAPQRQEESALMTQLETAKAGLSAKRASYQESIRKLNEGL